MTQLKQLQNANERHKKKGLIVRNMFHAKKAFALIFILHLPTLYAAEFFSLQESGLAENSSVFLNNSDLFSDDSLSFDFPKEIPYQPDSIVFSHVEGLNDVTGFDQEESEEDRHSVLNISKVEQDNLDALLHHTNSYDISSVEPTGEIPCSSYDTPAVDFKESSFSSTLDTMPAPFTLPASDTSSCETDTLACNQSHIKFLSPSQTSSIKSYIQTIYANFISGEKKTFKCMQTGCNFETESETAFTEHIPTHPEKKFKCTHQGCNYSEKLYVNVERHMRTHEINTSPCPHTDCTFRSSMKSAILAHIQRSHPEDEIREDIFKCTHPDCGRTAKLRCIITDHMNTHGKGATRCNQPDCRFTSTSKRTLLKHKSIHHPDAYAVYKESSKRQRTNRS